MLCGHYYMRLYVSLPQQNGDLMVFNGDLMVFNDI